MDELHSWIGKDEETPSEDSETDLLISSRDSPDITEYDTTLAAASVTSASVSSVTSASVRSVTSAGVSSVMSASVSSVTSEGCSEQSCEIGAGKTRVMVTGVTGFVASHITRKLLKSDRYIVHGTVRDRNDRRRIRRVTKFHNALGNLRLFECDLLNDANWDRAVKDCSYVIHVASLSDNTGGKLTRASEEAMRRVLSVCSAAETVKRVVLTSSITAMTGGVEMAGADRHITESDWGESSDQYCASKIIAEKTAWQMSKTGGFELVVINPTMCIGPVLVGDCAAIMLLKRILGGGYPVLPKILIPAVDVRDVADAHIAAMMAPTAPDKRIIVHGQCMWLKDMARLIQDEFKDQGYRVHVKDMPDWALSLAAKLSKSAKLIKNSVGRSTTYDTSHMHEILGIRGRRMEKAVLDTCYSMVEMKLVTKKAKYVSNSGYLDDTELSFENVLLF